MSKHIYLDYAAATPVDPQVLAAMQPYFSDTFYNPSAGYGAAQAVKASLETAHTHVARLLGAQTSEIIFTAGGTEANNLAILGVAQAFPTSHMVCTALEHDSVRAPMAWFSKTGGTHSEVLPQPDGIVDAQQVGKAITDATVLVSVMQANNEIGTVQPIRQIAQVIQAIKLERRAAGNALPLYLHTDACQAANYLDVHVNRLGVDLMTLNGGKIYGPKQSGALFVGSYVKLLPTIHGGGQERRLRSGTENVAGSIGFTSALDIAQTIRKAEVLRLQALQKNFLEQLSRHIPSMVRNGSSKHCLPNNVHITIPGQDNERLMYGLDMAGILVAAGSACSASKEESSHVLRAIGLTDAQARSSLRFTLGRATTREDLATVVQVLTKLLQT